MSTAYLNGTFVPLEAATVSVLDRGFLFGDGVYEVIPAYGGHLFRLAEHLHRLQLSLDGIALLNPHSNDAWRDLLQDLLARNPGDTPDASVYLQITRGAAPQRNHLFPEPVTPTVFAMCMPLPPVPDAVLQQGAKVVLLEDVRWRYCHLKTIALLPNVLLRHAAAQQDADEAILIENEQVTEGTSSNVFMVSAGKIITPPKSEHLLPGITRDLLLELAHAHAMPYEEAPIGKEMLLAAEEIWICSSTKEVLAVTRLDGCPVGQGNPGLVWQTMLGHFRDYKALLRRQQAS